MQTGSVFNPDAEGQYEFILRVSEDDDVVAQSSMIVQVGDVDPESGDEDDDDDEEDDDD